MAHKVTLRFTKIRQRVIQAYEENAQQHYCLWCQREVEILSHTQAIRILAVDGPTLGCLVAGGQVHTVQTISGGVWICKNSLFVR